MNGMRDETQFMRYVYAGVDQRARSKSKAPLDIRGCQIGGGVKFVVD